jgi:Cu(I)/Ag(I) efflux system membrane fusion protein
VSQIGPSISPPGAERPPAEDEAPPSGVAAMSIVRWALVALMAIITVGTWVYASVPREHTVTAGTQRFHCPMHPAVVQDRTGSCPICGMDLIAVEARTRSPISRQEGLPPGLASVDISADRTQLVGMRTAEVRRLRLTPRLRTVGFVSAREASLASVASRSAGWIEELRVQTGQRVERGQLLALVSSPDLVTVQQTFLNAVRSAREKDPSGQASAVATQWRRTLEAIGFARREIDEIERTGVPREHLRVRAPLGGHVARVGVVPGSLVQPGTELLQITDLASVSVAMDLHEPEMERIELGQRARFSVGSPPREFAGRIDFIAATVNPEQRTLQVRMDLVNRELRLRPGMHGDVFIDLAPSDGLAVPKEAVVDTGEHQYVFVSLAGGRFEPRAVRLGAADGEQVQVTDGLAEGDRVVTTANFLVDSESRLRAGVERREAPARKE